MIKIAICDDEIEICGNLERIIETYLKNRNIQFEIDIFYSADSILKYIGIDCSYDLLFLDIEMKGLSGINFGKKLRTDMKNEVLKIVYISWEESYAMKLFEVRPTDFIIKPFSVDRIYKVLDVVIMLIDCEMQYFYYQRSNYYEKILLRDILYFESINRIIVIHTVRKQIEFYGKLDDVFRKIDRKYFWRIHKSYLINHLYVKKLEYKQVHMTNDVILKISRVQQCKIRDMYLKLLKEN
ncbi:LytR/AlgR family response regulator transcription factor [Fusibacter bizertensis]